MPKMESFIDRSIGLTVITIYGEVNPLDLFKCIDHYYEGDRTNLVLFDFSDAIFENAGPEFPRKTLSQKERYSRKGDRKAFVLPIPVEKDLKGLLQEYCQTEANESNLDVFNNLIDANKWLMESKDAHR
ncbi:MAG: hypothetical protein GKR91_11330 [Pseudomonadales bacterium]|nr:hypothetical protein [Pseudomonadales bacterium]